MLDRTKETTKNKLKLSSSSKNVKVRQRKQSVTWKLMMSFVNSRLLCQNCRPSIFEATTLDVIIVRRLWLQLLRLPNIMAFRSLGLTFLSHREERALALQGSHYRVAHGEISEFWTRHWDCCTDERSYGVFQRVVRRKCEGVQSSQCSIHQEFQVGESELCQQPLLRPGRDKKRGEPPTLALEKVFPGQILMSLNNRNCRRWRSDPRPARLSQALSQ